MYPRKTTNKMNINMVKKYNRILFKIVGVK